MNDILPSSTPGGEISSANPSNIYSIVTIGLQNPMLRQSRQILYFVMFIDLEMVLITGSKYLEYISSIRIMNNNRTVI
jgi:hypothetical protein